MTPFDLNLRHLRAVAAIADRGSMSAAADAVSLTQPALTQGLAKLERQIGVALFERRPDGMAATHAGALFADRIRAALGHLADGAGASPRGFARPERLMTMTQARALLALAEAGGFTGASQATGLSQPAIHRAVRDLEQVIGIALAERRGHGVVLTPRGRRLTRGIRLAAGELAGALADTVAEPVSVRLAIGAMPLSRATLIPRAVARLVAEHPQAAVDIVEGSWRELVEPLRDGSLDLMVGALRPEGVAGLDQQPLLEDRVVIVGAANHPLAGDAAPSREALSAHPWIVGPPGSPLRAQWERLFGGAKLPPRPVECGSVMVIRGLLTRGRFLTLLSPDQIALEIESGVLAVVGPPLSDSARIIGVTTRAGWRPSRVQRHFLNFLQDF